MVGALVPGNIFNCYVLNYELIILIVNLIILINSLLSTFK